MTKNFKAIVPDLYRGAYEQYQFAPAVRIGDDLHVSGIIGLNPDQSMPDKLETQVANIFGLLAMILAEAGATLADVYSLTSYHVGDLGEQMGGFIGTKSEFIQAPHPVWTAVGITQLATPGAKVEVSAQARIGR